MNSTSKFDECYSCHVFDQADENAKFSEICQKYGRSANFGRYCELISVTRAK